MRLVEIKMKRGGERLERGGNRATSRSSVTLRLYRSHARTSSRNESVMRGRHSRRVRSPHSSIAGCTPRPAPPLTDMYPDLSAESSVVPPPDLGETMRTSRPPQCSACTAGLKALALLSAMSFRYDMSERERRGTETERSRRTQLTPSSSQVRGFTQKLERGRSLYSCTLKWERGREVQI